MSKKYTITVRRMQSAATQWLYCAVAALMVLSVVITLLPARANAYNQVSSRSIMMSSSAAGATNVAYQVNFTTVMNNISGNITSLSVDSSSNSTANRIVLTRTAGTVANGPVSFTLGNGTSNGITNPTSTVGTFYARILILASTDGTLPGSSTNENDATDAGGVAISTANQLHVTAKVQESLLFCVYTDTDCATGGNDVKLGDLNGVLASNSTTYTGSANFDVASNAVSGVSIHLKGTTLTSGSFTIDPAGSSCISDPTASSTEMFGLRMLTLPTGMTSTAPYNCASGHHAFDANTSTGIPSTFGQEIAHTTGASDILTSTIEFAAKSALTSEAGVYTTTLTLIATATY
jgi:hypothetical protein